MQIYDSWWLEVSKYLEGQGGLPDMILQARTVFLPKVIKL